MRQLVVRCGLLLALGPAAAITVHRDTFDETLGGWRMLTGEGELSRVEEPGRPGGALACRYRLADGLPALGAELPVPPLDARQVRFRLRTSARALLYFAVYERDGSGYGTFFQSLPGDWQECSLSFDRLRLTKETTDENNRLDVEQIASLGLADASSLLGELFAPAGERTLWLDEFCLDTADSPGAYSPDGRLPYLLDAFHGEPLTYLPLHGQLTLDTAAGLLLWSYGDQPAAGRLPIILGGLGPLPRTGATHLLLTLRVTRRTQLAIGLQEEAREEPRQDESLYVTVVEIRPGEQMETIAVALADLRLEQTTSRDENERLDLDQVGALVLGDVEVVLGGRPGDNTIIIEEIQLVAQ